jgi:glycosyltransferase involved in cell wall biosynthesis
MLTNRYGNHSGPDLSLVMPCYNEEAVVERTIARLLAAFGKAGYELELVAVDNGSWDGTTGILQGLAKQNPAVVYHRVEKNEGYGNGVTAGFPLCAAPWVGLIPADGQVDPEDVVRVYEAAVAANQWVVAKVRRLFRMDGFRRKVVSIVYNLLVRVLWPGLDSIDINGTPKILPRDLVPILDLRSKDWFLDPEILIKAHTLDIRVVEFNAFARMRSAGISHVKAVACWEFFRNLLAYRFSREWKRELIGRYPRVEKIQPKAVNSTVRS